VSKIIINSIPGDKSISHRALMLSAIAEGESCITNLLESEDVKATRAILEWIAAPVSQARNDGTGASQARNDGLLTPSLRGADVSQRRGNPILNCQNSGTTMRLLSGLLCGLNFPATFVGDESLMQRPMARVIKPLNAMGFNISANKQGLAPIRIHRLNKALSSERKVVKLTVPSAQVKSAILLANIFREGITEIIEPIKTRDHTEILLKQFGADISREGSRIILLGGKKLKATHIKIPGDFSSAAFFIVLATIKPNTDLLLKNIGINPTRTGLLTILKKMGADITLHNWQEICGEFVADIEVRSAQLNGIEIPKNIIALAIDEFPILFVAAACAEGKTILCGASELRVKESDRLKNMSINLNKLGIQTQLYDDGIEIVGGQLRGANVDSFGDHRVAMSMMVANQLCAETISVNNPHVINISFPNFSAELGSFHFFDSV